MSWWKDDSGAALITVMMLVAVMSSIAVASFSLLKSGIQRTVWQGAMTQAREYAFAAELIGAEKAEELAGNAALLSALGHDRNAGRISVPIDHGEVVGRITEISNRFNLTSLVTQTAQGRYLANPAAGAQFRRLLMGLGLGEREAESLTATLTDWQDSDGRPLALGAEAGAYSLLENPYAPNDHPIADVRELRLVRGFTAPLIVALDPFVCADPTLETRLNVNSLPREQALLLSAVLGGGLSHREAVELIDQRPSGGYGAAAAFWQKDQLKDREIEQAVRAQVGFDPVRFLLVVDVRILEARQRLSTMIRFYSDGTYHLVSRKFGA